MLNKILLCTFIFATVVHCIEIGDSQESESNTVNDQQKLLSRRRRYLTFPDGSSLQLVYDQIIGIVDMTNLHIFGITVALAWQLPHKTNYFEVNAPVDAVKDGVIVPVKDGVIAPHETDKIDYKKPSQNISEKYWDTYYNRKNYHSHEIDNRYYDYLKTKQSQYRPPLNGYDDWKKYRTSKKPWNYSHDVYPALRMRRQIHDHHKQINGSTIHPEVNNFLQHHRETRFNLYKSIEKYLNAKGENGEHCIKQAICETTHIESMNDRQNRNDPDSFVKELLRVIFSLPSKNSHLNNRSIPNKYDELFNEIVEYVDCSKKYPECSTSIWDKNFLL